MDATVSLLLVFGLTALTILLFWKLEKTWPGGTVVSLIAFVMFALSFFIPDEGSRSLQGLNGYLRINGIIGILLGLFSYMRHRRKGDAASEIDDNPISNAQTNPNKCPQCGLVNRRMDASCKRCGAQLQRST